MKIKKVENQTIMFEGKKSNYFGEVNELNIPFGKGHLKQNNGDEFIGNFINGKFENGKFTKSNGLIFEGSFINNKLCGKGHIKTPDGKLISLCGKDSYFKDFIPTGEIKIKKDNQICFQSEVSNGVLNGNCNFKFCSLNLNDITELVPGLEKYAKFYAKKGYKLDGSCKFLNGSIIFAKFNGVIAYDGEMQNQEFHGLGKLKTNKYIYSGNFKKGKFDGEGTFTKTDGFTDALYGLDMFSGIFKNGEAVKGTLLVNYANYSKTCGDELSREEYVRVMHEGEVKTVLNNKGQIKNIYREGFGTSYLTSAKHPKIDDNWSYKGEFKQDKYNGKGELKLPNGEIINGIFSDGKLVKN